MRGWWAKFRPPVPKDYHHSYTLDLDSEILSRPNFTEMDYGSSVEL